MMKSHTSKFTVLFLVFELSSFWSASLIDNHIGQSPIDLWFLSSSVFFGVIAAGVGLCAIRAWILGR